MNSTKGASLAAPAGTPRVPHPHHHLHHLGGTHHAVRWVPWAVAVSACLAAVLR